MKYRIISSRKAPAIIRRIPRLKVRKTSLIANSSAHFPIDTAELFGFGIFYDPYSLHTKRSEHTKIRLKQSLFSKATAFANAFFLKIQAKILALKLRRKVRPSLLPAIFGSLCGALAVAFLSLGFVIYSLFIKDYFGAYENVVIPNFVGSSYSADSLPVDSSSYNIHLSYKYDNEIPEGYIISQSPPQGVTRRVYNNGDPCDVFIVVSLGRKIFTMNDYSSFELRDAILELKNNAIKFSVKHVYSSNVEQGKIVYTSPAVGESFSKDDTVTLTVSLGPEKIYVTVPNIYSLTEARAEDILRTAGLRVGKVSYIQSEYPAGTVISQSHSFGSAVEKNTEISFSVSAGIKYNEKKMPDLYGLSIEQAKSKLAEYGLVVGNIYSVSGSTSKGTVIAQSVLPESTINSSITSIDIYVSS